VGKKGASKTKSKGFCPVKIDWSKAARGRGSGFSAAGGLRFQRSKDKVADGQRSYYC